MLHTFDHKFNGFDVKTGSFKSVTSTQKHSKNQQNNYNRYIDISLESLEEYLKKKNRKIENIKTLGIDLDLNTVFSKINENDFTNAKLELCKIFEAIAEKVAQQWDS